MDDILLLGTNHRLVEPSALGALPAADELRDRLGQARAEGLVEGFVVLATCNRVELYAQLSARDTGSSAILDRFPELATLPAIEKQGLSVVRHLIRVAGSLESMVLGENQILGQVRRAWQSARSAEHSSPILDEAFQQGIAAAKEIRTQTGLGDRPVSVASLACRVLSERVHEPRGLRVALLGAGQMVRKAAPALAELCGNDLLFVNRTLEKAEALAAECGGKALPLDTFLACPPAIDACLVALTRDEPVVDANLVGRIHAARADNGRSGSAPLQILDLCVPSAVASDVRASDTIELCSMDDLRRLSEHHADERRVAALRAEPIVEAHVQRLHRRLRARDLSLAGVKRAHVDLAEQQTRDLITRRFGHLSEADQSKLERSLVEVAKAHAHLHLKDLKAKASIL